MKNHFDEKEDFDIIIDGKEWNFSFDDDMFRSDIDNEDNESKRFEWTIEYTSFEDYDNPSESFGKWSLSLYSWSLGKIIYHDDEDEYCAEYFKELPYKLFRHVNDLEKRENFYNNIKDLKRIYEDMAHKF